MALRCGEAQQAFKLPQTCRSAVLLQLACRGSAAGMPVWDVLLGCSTVWLLYRMAGVAHVYSTHARPLFSLHNVLLSFCSSRVWEHDRSCSRHAVRAMHAVQPNKRFKSDVKRITVQSTFDKMTADDINFIVGPNGYPKAEGKCKITKGVRHA